MRNFNNTTSNQGGSRFGYRSRFGQQNRFGGRPQHGRNQQRSRIPKNLEISRLINKAVPFEQSEFTPIHTFQEFPFHQIIKANIALKGYNKLTPIQDQAMPHIIAGRDFVGIANTGTGKTAAFLLPLINKVVNNRNEKILILAPTRELAQQIFEEFVAFSKGLNMHGAICVGGVHVGSQVSALRRNPNFVIATPGRLKDLANRRLVNLKFFNTLVLDEADRMVDMGFIQDIKVLIGMLPTKRHSLFFSATIPPTIHTLIQQFLTDPVTVSVKFRETASNVDQDVIRVTDKSRKIDMLKGLLSQSEFNKVLIFGRTKRGVEKLSVILAEKGFKVASIHSNKSQASRQKALNLFKQSAIKILVATDVAARGLDISEVSHVINYDMPATYDDYIHRIGRTGRADKIGKALTFVE